MNCLLFTIVLLFPVTCHGWAPNVAPLPRVAPFVGVRLFMSSEKPNSEMDDSDSIEFDPEDPCWQDLYDDDCAMSRAYSARFVASDWIKSMPCGEGIEDCDMPEEVKIPEVRPHADVDVMAFLKLKRAKKIDEKPAEEEEGAPKP